MSSVDVQTRPSVGAETGRARVAAGSVIDLFCGAMLNAAVKEALAEGRPKPCAATTTAAEQAAEGK